MNPSMSLPLLVVFGLLPAVAGAQTPVQRITLGAEHSGLSGPYADWNGQSVRYLRQWSTRAVFEAELGHSHRYGLHDTEAAVGGSLPLAEQLTLGLRATYSPTHQVAPRHSASANLQWEFRRAWLLHGGWRHTRYDATPVNTGSLKLEHYFGDWSALAAVHATRALGRDTRSYELRASRYYGEGSSVGLILSRGDEATALGAGNVVLARVQALALVGRHGVSGPWALRYSLSRTEQGSFHTRTGASVGVEYDF